MDDSYPVTVLTITLIMIWAAAWFDLRTLRIPNALSVSGAILGLVIFTSDSGIAGLGHSLSGLGLGLLLMLPGYVLKATAAGDVKLMAAVGGLLGPHRLLGALLYTILVAGVIGLIIALIAWRTRGATAPFKRYGELIRFLLVTGRISYIGPRVGEALAGRMPLAVSIALGTTASLLWPLEFSTLW
jgi:prepilin peptidase CpaA